MTGKSEGATKGVEVLAADRSAVAAVRTFAE